jgi:hypothetical protein
MKTTLLKTGKVLDSLKLSKDPEATSQLRKGTFSFLLFLLANLFYVSNGFGQIVATGPSNPTVNTATSVTSPQNGYASDNAYAVFDANADVVRYSGFGLPVSGAVTILGIEVRLEGNRNGNRDLNVALTWNNGGTFTTDRLMPAFGATDGTVVLGGPWDTWGRNWNVTELANANFGVRCLVPAAATANVNLDHVQVRVYYAAPASLSFLTTSDTSFTVPAGVTSVTVDAWGAGAGGSSAGTAAGGGGGGAYTKGTFSGVSGTSSITLIIGAGGAAGAPLTAPGNFSRATIAPNSITANGGLSTNGRTGGAGGTASALSGIISASFAGGPGGDARSSTTNGNNEAGGGGGGSAYGNLAGLTGADGGSDDDNLTAGGAGTGNGGGGATADGTPNAVAGSFPGGGGGGRGEGTSSSAAGANGRIILSYTCPAYAITATSAATPVCISSPNAVVTVSGLAAGLPVGTYTVTYTRSNPLAAGQTATLTVSTAGTGTFTANGLANGSTITITNLASGTCTNAISTGNVSGAVTVNAAATANSGNPVSVCYTSGGISVNPDSSATASNNTSVNWTGGLGTWANPTSLTLAAYTPTAGEISAGSVVVTLHSVGLSPCAEATSNKTLAIGTQPNVVVSGNQTICSTPPASISGAITGSGVTLTTWTSSGTGTFGNASSLSTTYTASAADKTTGSVTLTLTTNDPAGPCVADSDSLTLTYEPEATVNAGVDQEVCSSSPNVTLAGIIGGSASSATWSTSGSGTFNPNNTTLNAVYQPSSTEITNGGEITLTLLTDDPANICGPVSDQMKITIYVVAVATAGNDQTICSSTIANISGTRSGTGVTTSTWTTSGTGTFGNAANLITNYTPSAADKTAGFVTLTLITNDPTGPCAAGSDSLTLFYEPEATVFAGVDQTVCSSAPNVTLAGTMGGSATSVTWSNGGGTFNPNNTTLNAIYTPSAGEIAAGTVTLTLTTNDPAGVCGALSDSMTILINQAATAFAGADQDYCTSTTSVTLSGSRGGTNVSSSTWTTSGTGAFGNAGLVGTTYTPSAADKLLASVTLTLTTNDPAGPCGLASDTMVINIFPAATVSAGANQPACSTQPITLAGVIGGGATSATWSAPSGTFSNPNSLTSTYTPSVASGNVVLTLTTDNPAGPCGALSSTMTVSVTPVLTSTDVTICQGQPGIAMTSSACADSAPASVVELPAAATSTGTGTAWGAPTNVFSDNDSRATLAGSASAAVVSQTLNVTNFGFAIPANAIIGGIQCSIARHRTGGLAGEVQDTSLRLLKAGVETGNNLGAADTNWPTSETIANYGSVTELWNTTWNASQINASNFGIAFVIDISQGFLTARTAQVDYVQLTVTYTIPGSVRWYTVSSGGTSIGSGTSFNPVGVTNSGLPNTNTPGTYTFYAECSTFSSCRTETTYTINELPSVNFTTLDPIYCADAASVPLTANHAGGTFTGSGITDNGNGTATFNPAAATVGAVTITYSYSDSQIPSCSNSTSQNITVRGTYPFYVDADGDSYGAGSAVLVCSVDGATPPANYSLNNTDCDDLDITKHATYPFYADIDGDSYGAGPVVNLCAVDGNTPPQAHYSVNNTDCDDNNPARHQTFAFYVDSEGDGFGAGDLVLVCAVDALTIPEGYSLNNTDCDPLNPLKHAEYPFYVDSDGDSYGAGVAVPLCAVNALTPPTAGYSLNADDCDDTKASVHPFATEIGYNLTDDDCDGSVDEGYPPKVTTIMGTFCNATLPTIDSYVYANLVAGAQGYRWRVTTMLNGNPTSQVQYIDTNLRALKLTQLANYAFATTYKIEVAVYYTGFLQPYTTSNCTVSTPVINTQLSVCGQTLTAMNNVIYANLIPFATGYRFEITDPLNGANTQTLDRALREFRMNLITDFPVQYGKIYSVRVAVRNTDGTYMPFGNPCNVSTPLFPTVGLQDSQCSDYIVPNNTSPVYANSFPGAIQYVFQLTGLGLPSGGAEVTKSLRVFSLNDFPQLVPGATYNVRVRLVFNLDDVAGPFGKVCTIVAPGASRQVQPEKAAFNAMAYPNPFAEHFSMEVTTAMNSDIMVKIYDMTGRLLESKAVKVTDVKSLVIGDSYPSGVYNVIVSQEDAVKTLRMIKR